MVARDEFFRFLLVSEKWPLRLIAARGITVREPRTRVQPKVRVRCYGATVARDGRFDAGPSSRSRVCRGGRSLAVQFLPDLVYRFASLRIGGQLRQRLIGVAMVIDFDLDQSSEIFFGDPEPLGKIGRDLTPGVELFFRDAVLTVEIEVPVRFYVRGLRGVVIVVVHDLIASCWFGWAIANSKVV